MEISTTVITWISVGLLLIAGELFTGTFHLLFFGLAGLLTAALVYFGIEPLWIQIAVFGGLSLLSFFYIQKKFSGRRQGSTFETDRDQVITLTADIPALQESTIQYQGAPWTAVNTETIDMNKGQKVVIAKTEGVKIFLKSHRH